MKKFISVLLALILVFSISASVFASAEKVMPHYEKMLVFGDSITCAFGNPTSTWLGVAEGSYIDIVGKTLGVSSTVSLSFGGACIAQMLDVLNIEVSQSDVDSTSEFINYAVGPDMVKRIEQIKAGNDPDFGNIDDRIAESDLIVIAVGGNDMGYIPSKSATDKYDELIAAGKSEQEAIKEAAAKFVDMASIGIKYFFGGYYKMIEKFQSINPNARIVLIGNYNPFINVSLTRDDPFQELVKAGAAVSAGTELMNAQLELWAKQYGCTYVDVYDLSTSFPAQVLTEGIDTMGGLDTHPTYEGHAYIAEQILKALSVEGKRILLPCAGSMNFCIRGWNAGRFTLNHSFASPFWTITEESSGMKLTSLHTAPNSIERTDKDQFWLYNGGFYQISAVSVDSRFGFCYLKFQKNYLDMDTDGNLISSNKRSVIGMYAN